MKLQQIFISNLKRIRKERGYSQMKLSEKCDTTSNYIGQIEMGRRIPSFEKIEIIATALDISPHELFSFDLKSKQKEQKLNTIDYLMKMPANVKKDIISRLISLVKKDIETSFNPQDF